MTDSASADSPASPEPSDESAGDEQPADSAVEPEDAAGPATEQTEGEEVADEPAESEDSESEQRPSDEESSGWSWSEASETEDREEDADREKDGDRAVETERFTLDQLPRFGALAWQRWRDRALVILAAALVFIPLLGSFGLWDPWETHYGEVARQITERNDWISTWWGSHWQDTQGQTEGSYFYSKPVFLMWLMALGMEIFGFSEWGVRLGVVIIAIFVLAAVYTMGASIFRRRTGFLMAAILGTSPFFFFLSRQAQTDMPFVGLMTIGLCFFMMATFGEDRNEPAGTFTWGLTLGSFGLIVIPQLWILFVGLLRWRGHPNNPVMQSLTRPPELGIAVGGIPLAIGALLTGIALYVGRTETDWARRRRRWLAWVGLAITWLPLVGILIAAVVTSPSPGRDANGWWIWGPTQAALYGTAFVTAIYLTVAKPDRGRRSLYMLVFYLCTALATLSKGLLGFLLPGAVLFFYILLTREWRMLKRVHLISGTLLFIAAGVPWYAGMLIEHTQGFWQRFFVHDHFKRLASGVHQIDTGSFEHFIRWLGYGLFPWSALVPAAFGQFFTGRGLRVDNDRGRARLLLLLWAVLAFTLFTLSSTKFHHYTFPVVPPLALLVALAVDDALDREVPEPWPLYLVGIGVLVLVAWDMIYDPQVIKDMFTYKYERKWDGDAWNSTFRFWLTIISIPGLFGILWLLVRNRVVRRISFGLIFVSALGMTIFGLDYYMPEISSTWSQKGVWDAYYSHCNRIDVPEDPTKREQLCAETGNWSICEHYDEKKRYCEEEAIAYKLNWRGETFYTQNEVLPLRDNQDWDSFIERREREPFYGIMQRGRYHGGFKRSLPERLKGDSCILFKRNIKFILIKVPCTDEDKQRARELFGEDLKSKPPDGGLPPK